MKVERIIKMFSTTGTHQKKHYRKVIGKQDLLTNNVKNQYFFKKNNKKNQIYNKITYKIQPQLKLSIVNIEADC